MYWHRSAVKIILFLRCGAKCGEQSCWKTPSLIPSQEGRARSGGAAQVRKGGPGQEGRARSGGAAGSGVAARVRSGGLGQEGRPGSGNGNGTAADPAGEKHRRLCLFRQGGKSGKVVTQSIQSDGPVRFLIFFSLSIFLLASLVAGRRLQCTAGTVRTDLQGMYSTIPIHWNIKSAPASPGRCRVGSSLYVFCLLG
jgi:hypothetical protein